MKFSWNNVQYMLSRSSSPLPFCILAALGISATLRSSGPLCSPFPTATCGTIPPAAPSRSETSGRTEERTDLSANQLWDTEGHTLNCTVSSTRHTRDLSPPLTHNQFIIPPHLGRVHPSPNSSKMVISLGVRWPLRKFTVSRDRWGERTMRGRSGLPQLCNIWIQT